MSDTTEPAWLVCLSSPRPLVADALGVGKFTVAPQIIPDGDEYDFSGCQPVINPMGLPCGYYADEPDKLTPTETKRNTVFKIVRAAADPNNSIPWEAAMLAFEGQTAMRDFCKLVGMTFSNHDTMPMPAAKLWWVQPMGMTAGATFPATDEFK